MAISFLDDINLNNLEALNLVVQNLGSDPTGVEGKIIYNTGSNTIKYYNGTEWVELDGLSGITGTIGTVPRFGPGTTAIRDSQLETSGEGSSQTFTFNTTGETSFKGNISLDAGILDNTGGLGTNGQLLSSTGTKTSWINAPVSYTKWVLTGDSGSQDILDGNTVLITGGTGIKTIASATDKLTIIPAFDEYSSATPGENAGLLFGLDGDMENSQIRIQEVNGFPLSLFAPPSSNVNFNSKKITNLLNPASAQDAATKAYVDSSVAGGLTVKGGFNADTGVIGGSPSPGNLFDGEERVAIAIGDYYVVTTAGNFFSNTATPLTVGDSVLVQTAAAAGASVESDFAIIQSDTDLATLSIVGLGNVNASIDDEFLGMNVVYSAGTAKVGLGINSLTAVSTTDKASYLAIFDEDESANRKIDIQNLATKLNPITSFAGTSSSGTSHTFTHNLGSNDVIVQLYDLSEGVTAGDTVYADVTRTNTNVVTVTTAASANIRCLIQKVG